MKKITSVKEATSQETLFYILLGENYARIQGVPKEEIDTRSIGATLWHFVIKKQFEKNS